MKALRIDAPGGPEAIRVVEIPEPVPGPGELTLDVKAAGVNHLDVWVRRGLPGLRYPLIPGSDAAGVIVETGRRALLSPSTSCGACEFCRSGEKPLCLGYRIFGEHRDGTHRARICVPEENLLPIPDSLSFEAAAAAPLVGLTAWRMLMSKGRLKAGETVFIWGAAAGVGTACLQYAKLAGARVIATASTAAKAARLAGLDADHVLDLSREDPVARVKELTGKRGCDLVVDTVGRDTWERSLRIARRGGRIVTCGATSGHEAVTDLRQVFYRQLEILGSTMGNDEELRQALAPVFEGRLAPVVDRVLPLERAAEAHLLLESRQACGKLILVP